MAGGNGPVVSRRRGAARCVVVLNMAPFPDHSSTVVKRTSSQVRIKLPVSSPQFFGNFNPPLLRGPWTSDPFLGCRFKVFDECRSLLKKFLFGGIV